MSSLLVSRADEGTTPKATILKSTNGQLDIEAAWKWDQYQILDWLEELVKSPERYGIDPEYIDPEYIDPEYIDPEYIDPEYIDPPDEVQVGTHLKLTYVVEFIKHLRMRCFIIDPRYHKFSFDPSKVVYTWFYPKTTYAGYELPVRTLYDAIGWILSITASPSEGIANQNNFCLPLIGLFGKWCSVLLPVESLPTMLHVAYWYDEGRFRLLLGATPGADHMMFEPDQNVWHQTPLEPWSVAEVPESTINSSPWSANKQDDIYWGVRGWDIIWQRQALFEKYRFPLDMPQNHKVDRMSMSDADSGFGRCAETFIYLWMLQRKNIMDMLSRFAVSLSIHDTIIHETSPSGRRSFKPDL